MERVRGIPDGGLRKFHAGDLPLAVALDAADEMPGGASDVEKGPFRFPSPQISRPIPPLPFLGVRVKGVVPGMVKTFEFIRRGPRMDEAHSAGRAGLQVLRHVFQPLDPPDR